MHLDTDQVQRLLHDELEPAGSAAVRQHLGVCADCRTRVEAAERDEREIMGLLHALDHAPPAITAQHVLARARGRHVSPVAMRWAAGLLLAFGVTSAAYAIPGSPLRAWIDAVGSRLIGGGAKPRAPVALGTPVTEPAGPRPTAGIAVAPGRDLILVFTSSVSAQVSVSIVDEGAEVAVLATPGAATFTADGERLLIAISGDAARVDVRIPRAAPRVEILVNGARRYLKEAARITTPGTDSPTEPYVISIAPDR